jgi:hypothetical protein
MNHDYLEGNMMIERKDKKLEKIIKQGSQLARNKNFQEARKLLSNGGVCYFTIDRVLYQPHNIRESD